MLLMSIDNVLLHLVVEKAARVANVDRGLNLISSQYPDFNSCLLKCFNRLLDLLL